MPRAASTKKRSSTSRAASPRSRSAKASTSHRRGSTSKASKAKAATEAEEPIEAVVELKEHKAGADKRTIVNLIVNAIKEGGTSRSGLSRTKIRSWVEEVHGDLTLGRFNKELSRAMDMDLIRQIVQHFVLTDKAKAELKAGLVVGSRDAEERVEVKVKAKPVKRATSTKRAASKGKAASTSPRRRAAAKKAGKASAAQRGARKKATTSAA